MASHDALQASCFSSGAIVCYQTVMLAANMSKQWQ